MHVVNSVIDGELKRTGGTMQARSLSLQFCRCKEDF